MEKKVKVVGSFGGVFRLGFARFRPPIARAAHLGDRVASTSRGEQVPYRSPGALTSHSKRLAPAVGSTYNDVDARLSGAVCVCDRLRVPRWPCRIFGPG